MRVLRGILAASRPLSWVNTAVPFALTYLLAQGEFSALLVVGFIFFLIPYNIAMHGINDVFDYESDIVNPRKGGVEGAVLPKTMHRPLLIASAVTVLPFALYLFAVGTWASGAALTLALFTVVAYSAPPLRFKEVPVLDSATSSAHFTLPAVVGALVEAGEIDGRLALALAAFYLWGDGQPRARGRAGRSVGSCRRAAIRGDGAGCPNDHAVRGRAVRSGGRAVLRATGPGVGCGTAWPGIRGQYVEVLERH